MLTAQIPFGTFEEEFMPVTVGSDDGIVSSDNKGFISEDQYGLIWMASNRGILRYDGYQCINFSKYLKEKFPDKVKINQENTVFADSLDQIWMGGQKGLRVYNLRINKLEEVFLDKPLYSENFRNQIKRILIFEKDLYVCTNNGVFILDLTTHKVKDAYLTNGVIQEDRHNTFHAVQGVYPHLNDSLIYIQANNGMHVVNKSTKLERIITTDKLAKSEYWGDNGHWFYQGTVVDNVIISSTYNTGIVHFDIATETYDVFLPDPTRKLNPNRNIFKSITALNDSISILTGAARGLFIYEYPEQKLTKIKNAPHFGNWGLLDSYGHYWVGKWGELFRSKRKLSSIHNQNYRSLQLGQTFSNGKTIGYPSLENIEALNLNESQDNIKMFVSQTQSYFYDSLMYEYKLCDKNWIPIEDHIINIDSLSGGNHYLRVRVSTIDNVLEEIEINIHRNIPWFKKWYNLLGILGLITLLYYLIYKWRMRHLLDKQRIKNEYELKIAQLNTSALRSRMNPHFLFNTLNSIKHHALFKEKEATSQYVTDFAQLIRGILEYSEQDFISLEEDIDWVRNYINIENKRFRVPFSVTYKVDENLDLKELKIPPLLIQPYIENAIWHGLQYKKSNKLLSIKYLKLENGYSIEIEDNGIGREASEKLSKKTAKKSLGMKITKDRIHQINGQNEMIIDVDVKDLINKSNDALGTKIKISITQTS